MTLLHAWLLKKAEIFLTTTEFHVKPKCAILLQVMQYVVN